VTRRASLPGADELFRRTDGPLPPSDDGRSERVPHAQEVTGRAEPRPPAVAPTDFDTVVLVVAEEAKAKPRHDEKVTFYCTGSELTRLEKARLSLRSDHKLSSDRGRIVRAALAEILEDFEDKGPQSALLRRLSSGG
jgi:hypothetical protein